MSIISFIQNIIGRVVGIFSSTFYFKLRRILIFLCAFFIVLGLGFSFLFARYIYPDGSACYYLQATRTLPLLSNIFTFVAVLFSLASIFVSLSERKNKLLILTFNTLTFIFITSALTLGFISLGDSKGLLVTLILFCVACLISLTSTAIGVITMSLNDETLTKNTKMWGIILTISSIIVLLEASSSVFFQRLDKFEYSKVYDNGVCVGVSIDGYLGKTEELSIPDTLGKQPVIAIRSIKASGYAYDTCSFITRVTIPQSVERIEDNAFSYCVNLTYVEWQNNIQHIGDEAFYRCESLHNIWLPSSLDYIGDRAFAFCYNLPEITIPDSVSHVGDDIFLK